MKTTLAVCLFLSLSGCPNTDDPCFYDSRDCDAVYVRAYGVKMDIKVQPGAKMTAAEVDVVITRPHSHRYSVLAAQPQGSTYESERPVEEWDDPYEEEVTLKLHWSCPTLEKSGEVEVTIPAKSAEGKVEISDLPPQPQLTVYPWEFKRGLECLLMTEDEKTAQEEEAKAKQDNSASDNRDEDEKTSDEEKRDEYRGKRAFFIKKPLPEVKLSQIEVVAGNPDSYINIKVELLRNEVAVVAGDRSFDLEVEVKLPWSCTGVSPQSGDTHIVIPAGAGSGNAMLIMPAQQAVKLTCTVAANAYIDSFIIGKSNEPLRFDIPKL